MSTTRPRQRPNPPITMADLLGGAAYTVGEDPGLSLSSRPKLSHRARTRSRAMPLVLVSQETNDFATAGRVLWRLSEFREQQLFICDINVKVEGSVFACHRLILSCASHYLIVLLSCSWSADRDGWQHVGYSRAASGERIGERHVVLRISQLSPRRNGVR